MDKQKLSDKLEGYRSRNQKNHDYINKDLPGYVLDLT